MVNTKISPEKSVTTQSARNSFFRCFYSKFLFPWVENYDWFFIKFKRHSSREIFLFFNIFSCKKNNSASSFLVKTLKLVFDRTVVICYHFFMRQMNFSIRLIFAPISKFAANLSGIWNNFLFPQIFPSLFFNQPSQNVELKVERDTIWWWRKRQGVS